MKFNLKPSDFNAEFELNTKPSVRAQMPAAKIGACCEKSLGVLCSGENKNIGQGY